MSVSSVHEALAAGAALRAAASLGVVDCLGATPLDARGLARACGVSERGSRALLAALAALDLVERTPAGHYRTTPAADLLTDTVVLFDGVADAVRTGQPAQAWDSRAVAGAVYPRLVELLADAHRAAVERAADLLTGGHVLDLAAGAAPWTPALAARDASTTVTALDLPEVLPRTHRVVKEQGLEHRYRFLGADAFSDDLGGPYDAVVVANFCHLFGAEANLRLLRRVRRILAPGGRLAIIDSIPSGTHDPPPPMGLYELSLLLRTRDGAAHPFSAYVDWLTRCGYRGIEPTELDPATRLTLVLATLD